MPLFLRLPFLVIIRYNPYRNVTGTETIINNSVIPTISIKKIFIISVMAVYKNLLFEQILYPITIIINDAKSKINPIFFSLGFSLNAITNPIRNARGVAITNIINNKIKI